MTKIVIYPQDNGRAAVLSPAPGVEAEAVAANDVPDGVPFRIIDATDLPPGSAWVWAEEGPITAFVAEQSIATFTAAIDAHVESTARAKQYNSAAHLASYVASTVPTWAAEAQAFVAWRDAVWLFALAEMQVIQAGDKPVPTIADLVASLPEIEWP